MDISHVHTPSVTRPSHSALFWSDLRETLSWPALQYLGWGILVAASYYLGTKLGFELTPQGRPIAMLWPPNAILLAALLLAPYRIWWILLVAVLPAHLLVQVRAGVPVLTAAGWFIGNASEALIGAACVRRFAKTETLFDSVRGLFVFLTFGAILAPLVTSFLDAATVVSTGFGQGYWLLWTSRLFSNVLAELVFVPTILIVCLKAPGWFGKARAARCFEAAALAMGVVLVSVLVFGAEHTSPNVIPALLYAPLPLLLWAGLRFGMAGLSPSLLAIALISIWNAMMGRGPFTSHSMESNVLSLQVLLVTVAIPFMLLANVMVERKRTEESLREVSRRLIDAQEKERERIARELHDDIGQQLVLVELGLNRFSGEVGPALAPHVEDLRSQVAEISRSARDLSHGLHPSQLDHLGLGAALRRLCQEVAQNTSLEVHCDVENLTGLPRDFALCLYRIAQEGLQNVVKHSGATEVALSLQENGQWLVLKIVDNGTGFAGEGQPYAGLGLIGMQERLRSVNGEIRISSRPGSGTGIEVTVPLAATGDGEAAKA